MTGPDDRADDRDDTKPTRELIRRAKAGDEQSLDDLVAKILPVTQALARNMWIRPVQGYEAEDIHQTVLARLLGNLEQFRGEEKAQLVAWFKTALKRRSIDLARRSDGSPVVVGNDAGAELPKVSAAQDSPATWAAKADERARLQEAVQHLDAVDREAIVEHDFKSVPMAELAQRYGINVEAMKKRLQRARGRLARILDDRTDES